MRVAVIGAGASGLCALKHLKYHPKEFRPVGFEMGHDVGGTWNYTDQTGTDERGLPIMSSMYKNLSTNLPKEVMAFPDFPFDSALPSFISHTDVAEYLRRYTDNFGLRDLIKFNTVVAMVTPVSEQGTKRWCVTYSSTDDRTKQATEEFDAVIVCNGHYSMPLIPDIPGNDMFQGEIMHSHNYRRPTAFEGKQVLLLGAGASGQDIAIDISSTAKQVFLSSRKPPLKCQLPVNVYQISGIKCLTKTSCVFENGEKHNIDCLLLCTGYKYHFPFLDPNIGLSVDEDQRVTPLYKHIFHTEFPSLCFIGLCKTVCPFPHFDVQVETVMSVLAGKAMLPSKREMDKDAETDLALRMANGLPRRYAHFMGPYQWDYNAQLVNLGEFEDPIPQAVKDLYDYIHRTRVLNLTGYKKSKYELVGKNSFKVFE